MTSQDNASFDIGQSPNNSSQDCSLPPSNQLSSVKTDGLINISALDNVAGTSQGNTLEEILSDFVPFDSSKNLAQPFENESERDKAYLQEIFAEFIQVIIEFWAWNVARVCFTTQTESERLYEQHRLNVGVEKKQGMSDSFVTSDATGPRTTAFRLCTDFFDAMRTQLQEFVVRMKSAIAALRENH